MDINISRLDSNQDAESRGLGRYCLNPLSNLARLAPETRWSKSRSSTRSVPTTTAPLDRIVDFYTQHHSQEENCERSCRRPVIASQLTAAVEFSVGSTHSTSASLKHLQSGSGGIVRLFIAVLLFKQRNPDLPNTAFERNALLYSTSLPSVV